MLKQTIVPLTDLQQLILNCPQCSTEFRLTLTDKMTSTLTPLPDVLVCPLCAKDFSWKLKSSIDQFRQAHQALVAASDGVMGFRIKADEPTASPEEPTAITTTPIA